MVLKSDNSIVCHEKDCEYRDILCIYPLCNETCSVKQLQHHVKFKHENLDINLPSKGVKKNGLNFILKCHDKEKDDNFTNKDSDALFSHPITFEHNKKKFFLQSEADIARKSMMLWIQLFGSKFEAKNFQYWIQIAGDLTVGKSIYEGPVQSIDDKKTDVFKSQVGLVLPFEFFEKCVQDATLTVEFGFKDLKLKEENSDQKSVDSSTKKENNG